METVLLAVHVTVCIGLIGLILLQQGKGADVGASFGGGASQTVFGAAGSATFLTRVTKWLAIVFFSTSLALAYLAREKSEAQNTALVPAAAAEQPAAGDVPAGPSGAAKAPAGSEAPSGDVPSAPSK